MSEIHALYYHLLPFTTAYYRLLPFTANLANGMSYLCTSLAKMMRGDWLRLTSDEITADRR